MIERLADPMSEYSIGIEDHYAWANLVSVTTPGPNEILLIGDVSSCLINNLRLPLITMKHSKCRFQKPRSSFEM